MIDSGLPPWRQRLAAAAIGLVRVAVGYLLLIKPITLLVLEPSSLTSAFPFGVRAGMTLILCVGLLLFALRRTVLAGALLLGAALGVFQWMVLRAGEARPLRHYLYALALLAVLTVSELVSRRLRALAPVDG
jgi:hypothetical protein